MSPHTTVNEAPPLPHSIEAEQALLGAILVNNDALDMVDSILTSKDFFEPLHQMLFEKFTGARRDGRHINVMLANAMLSDALKSADIGGLTVSQYIARVAAEATTVINAPDYARTIAEFADKRKLISVADSIRDAANHGADVSPASLAVEAIESLDAVTARYASAHVAALSFDSAADRSIARMQDAMQRGNEITGVTTGLRDLDAKLNGWQRGEFIILAGRPGMGKSGLIISSLRQSAQKGANALLFSLEMLAESVTDRMLSDACYRTRSPIAYSSVARGGVSNEQAEAVISARRDMRSLSIRIDPQGGLSVAQIAARARRYKQQLERQGKTLDILAVDHLHIVKASNRYSGNRVAEITELSAGLKALAKELNVPVVALAQLSRQVETRDDKRPVMADLRDSGSLEQDADAILFVYREEYYLRQALSDPVKDDKRKDRLSQVLNRLEVNIAKQRNGPVGTVELFFDAAANAARDISIVGFGRAVA